MKAITNIILAKQKSAWWKLCAPKIGLVKAMRNKSRLRESYAQRK